MALEHLVEKSYGRFSLAAIGEADGFLQQLVIGGAEEPPPACDPGRHHAQQQESRACVAASQQPVPHRDRLVKQGAEVDHEPRQGLARDAIARHQFV
jgi:hypothetical protein